MAMAGLGVLPGAGPPSGEPQHPHSYVKVRVSYIMLKRLSNLSLVPARHGDVEA